MKRIVLSLLLALLALPAYAQSSAQPVLPGSLTSTGCPPGVTVCFTANGPTPADAVTVHATGSGAGVLSNMPIATAGYAVVDVDVQSFSATSLTPSATFDGGTTYEAVSCVPLNPGAGNNAKNSFTAVGQWECPAGDHFELTQVGSGSVTAYALLKRGITSPYQNVAVSSGTSAAAVEPAADGLSNGSNGLLVQDYQFHFNGATWDRSYYCTSSATVSATAGATTQIVALSAGKTVHVCSFSVSMSAAGTAQWEYGTGTNCGTGTTALTAATALATGTPWTVTPAQEVFRTASGSALCLAAVTGNVTGYISYAQF